MRRPEQASSRGSPAQRKRESPAHRNQAVLEIQAGAVSNVAIQGLVNDWIAPMIADHIIENVLRARNR
jgi:hypothetical protein